MHGTNMNKQAVYGTAQVLENIGIKIFERRRNCLKRNKKNK